MALSEGSADTSLPVVSGGPALPELGKGKVCSLWTRCGSSGRARQCTVVGKTFPRRVSLQKYSDLSRKGCRGM